MSADSLGKFLESDSGLSRYAAHAGRLQRLQRAFEKAAPAALVRSGRVANLKQGIVVIYAVSGAAAAKLRQLAPRLTDVFRQISDEINEVQVKVQPAQGTGTPPPKTLASLKSKTKQGLEGLAERLPEDSPLKRALARFTRQARTED